MLAAVAHVITVLSLSFATGVWPLAPRPDVVEEFAPPAERWGSGHRGVDLLGRAGQTVRAPRPGRVTFAGTLAGRGVVVVSHGSTRTTYEPVSAAVRVGDLVDVGERIGTLQSVAGHCWPRTCLHWGLIEGATYLDPLSLVGGGPVRLLPYLSPLPDSAGFPPVPPAPLLGPLPSPPPAVAAPVFPLLAPVPPAPPVGFARPAGGPAGTPVAAGPW